MHKLNKLSTVYERNESVSQYSAEETGNALKVIVERMKLLNNIKVRKTPKHICTNCKHRHMVQGYDQQWGSHPIVENWCGKSKELMHTFIYSKGNDIHFSQECDFFEYGEGVLEQCD